MNEDRYMYNEKSGVGCGEESKRTINRGSECESDDARMSKRRKKEVWRRKEEV
jgi:hypothetical protein